MGDWGAFLEVRAIRKGHTVGAGCAMRRGMTVTAACHAAQVAEAELADPTVDAYLGVIVAVALLTLLHTATLGRNEGDLPRGAKGCCSDGRCATVYPFMRQFTLFTCYPLTVVIPVVN